MKKLISICILLFLASSLTAQEKKKSKYSELNKDQLTFALNKSKKTIKTGKILTFAGLGAATIGLVMVVNEGTKAVIGYDTNENAAYAGAYIALFGGVITYTGIPLWIVGATRRNKIELELVKFNLPGSASLNGIGITVMF